MIRGNEPANSITLGGHRYKDGSGVPPSIEAKGLTIRQYFAAKAMSNFAKHSSVGLVNEEVARLSVQLADALIAELNKEK